MSSPRVQANPQSSLPFGEEAKPGFRTKTAATRLTPGRTGRDRSCRRKRGTGSLRVAARDRSVRCATAARRSCRTGVGRSLGDALRALNLFHAAAEAAAEGRQLLPDSVLKIRDQADARKLQQARKLLEEFFAREGKERARMP